MDNFGIYKLISSLKNGEVNKNFNKSDNLSENLSNTLNDKTNAFSSFLSLIPTLLGGQNNNNILTALTSLLSGAFKNNQPSKTSVNLGNVDGDFNNQINAKRERKSNLNLQNNNPLIKTFLSHDEFVKKVKEKSEK
jgi:hypothetical protein